MQKYNKFCTSDILIRCIEAPQKDQQTMHIMMSVFKKSLSWIEEKYGRDGLLDAVHKIKVKKGKIEEPLVWLYVVNEGFSYYQMPFRQSEFVNFTQWNMQYVKFKEEGVFAVLTQKDIEQVEQLNRQREVELIKKFTKISVFYPYYLEQQHVQAFIPLIRIKRLGYGKTLNWKDQDSSHKIGVVYKGVLSIEYPWKRNIEIAQLTKRKYFTNKYIKDQLEEIQDYELQTVEPKSSKLQELPKFKYVSKSNETVLLIFNVRLIKQSPYNVNPDLLPFIKRQYEKYSQYLQKNIGFSQFSRLYRNKSSIKEQLKKQQAKETVKRNISLSLSKTSIVTSPILQTYAAVDLQRTPLSQRTIQYPQYIKQYAKNTFRSDITPKSRLYRAKTIEIDRARSQRRLIHNTWLEEMSKKKEQATKSFSTLQTLTTFHPERQKKHQELLQEIAKEEKPEFFVPNQFVKKKLRLKYEGLVNKVRNMDLTIRKDYDKNINSKMEMLQSYIDSRRIIKINKTKQFKLLRNKVLY